MRRYQLAVVACLLLMPARLATAQTASPPESGRGPMIVERVFNGPAIMPELKLTDIDGHSGTLAGASGGWMIDNMFLVGAGGYWLTSQGNGRRLAYGGAVLEWLRGTDGRFGYAVRGLVGGGRATLTENVMFLGELDRAEMSRRQQPCNSMSIATSSSQNLKPISWSISLRGSGSMRAWAICLVGAEGDFDRRLRGVTGSIGLQIRGSRSRRQ